MSVQTEKELMHVSLLIQVGHEDGEPTEVGFEWAEV